MSFESQRLHDDDDGRIERGKELNRENSHKGDYKKGKSGNSKVDDYMNSVKDRVDNVLKNHKR